MDKKYKNWDTVFAYANGISEGRIIANKYRVKACKRFLKDVENEDYDSIHQTQSFL